MVLDCNEHSILPVSVNVGLGNADIWQTEAECDSANHVLPRRGHGWGNTRQFSDNPAWRFSGKFGSWGDLVNSIGALPKKNAPFRCRVPAAGIITGH
jgi:hypothetical protein